MRRRVATLAVFLSTMALAAPAARAQAPAVPLEYQVKAAYLFNFTRFVEWPARAAETGPFTICVAGRNPFGDVLAHTVRHEQVNGRPIQTRLVVNRAAGCDVLFIPRGVPHEPYLRAARGLAVLTVGETPPFLGGGGIVNFVVDEGRVRFEIDPEAAADANLKVSSRLLRLAMTSVSDHSDPEWGAP